MAIQWDNYNPYEKYGWDANANGMSQKELADAGISEPTNLKKLGDKFFAEGASPDDIRQYAAYAPFVDDALKGGHLIKDDDGKWYGSTQLADTLSKAAGVGQGGGVGGWLNNGGGFWALASAAMGGMLGGAFPGVDAAGTSIPAGQTGLINQVLSQAPAPVEEGAWNMNPLEAGTQAPAPVTDLNPVSESKGLLEKALQINRLMPPIGTLQQSQAQTGIVSVAGVPTDVPGIPGVSLGVTAKPFQPLTNGQGLNVFGQSGLINSLRRI